MEVVVWLFFGDVNCSVILISESLHVFFARSVLREGRVSLLKDL
jgi:hypothetical protein